MNITEINDEDVVEDDDCPIDECYCSHCNGSGEGMYDGSVCRYCNGSGVERDDSRKEDWEAERADQLNDEAKWDDRA